MMLFCVLLLFLVDFNANSFVRLFCISVIFSVDSCLTLFVYFCSSHPTSYHTCQICCHITIINGCCLFVCLNSVCLSAKALPRSCLNMSHRCHVVVCQWNSVAAWDCLTISHRCHVWLSDHTSPLPRVVVFPCLTVENGREYCIVVCMFECVCVCREREREREKERENMCVYVCLRMCIVHLWLVSRK